MRKLVVANDFLAEAAEVLRQGKRVKVRIDGQSMFPFIIGGKDVVEIDPLPADSELPAWCCAGLYRQPMAEARGFVV